MQKLSFTFLLLLALLQLHTATPQDASEILTNIYKDEYGLFVKAYPSDYDERSSANRYVRTLLSFSSNETILPSRCLSFDSFDCTQGPNCNQTSTDETTIITHNMKMEGPRASAKLMLTVAGWTLNSSAILASRCSAYSLRLGEGRQGIIGLGTGGSSRENYIGPKLFSIILNQDNITKENDLMGNITFGFFPAPELTSPTSVFPADANWQIHFSNASLHIGGKTLPIPTGKVLFDLHFDAIGVPDKVFDAIVQGVENATGRPCSYARYLPSCYWTDKHGKVKFPDLILELNIEGKSYKLTLMSYMYIREYKIDEDRATLNFKAFGDDDYYMMPGFKDSIVLDSRVMHYYQTVFNFTQGTNKIELYHSRIPPSPKTESDSFWGEFGKIVAVGLSVVILGSVLVYLVIYRKSRNLKRELREPLQEEEHFKLHTNV